MNGYLCAEKQILVCFMRVFPFGIISNGLMVQLQVRKYVTDTPDT